MAKPQPSTRFEFTGGMLCLDFANTARHAPPPRDDLGTYRDLVAWGKEGGSIAAAEARSLDRAAAASPERAATALERARRLRDAIYATFSRVAAGRTPDSGDLRRIEEFAVAASRHFRIVPREKGYRWEVSPSEGDLQRPLWPVARSAAELLTSDAIGSVRECALETCAWLFLDSSRNQKRRWCDMKICGNRSKARRYYERMRESADE